MAAIAVGLLGVGRDDGAGRRLGRYRPREPLAAGRGGGLLRGMQVLTRKLGARLGGVGHGDLHPVGLFLVVSSVSSSSRATGVTPKG